MSGALPARAGSGGVYRTVPVDHIIGTEFDCDSGFREVQSFRRVRAGCGKVAAVAELVSCLMCLAKA